MKTQLLFLMALAVFCHEHAHKKKHHVSKKGRKGTTESDISYDDFVNNRPSSRRQKKVSSRQEPPQEFDEAFLAQFKKVIKAQFLWRKLEESGETEVMAQKDLQLNQYGLYVHDVNDDSINGLIDMIRLDEMVTQEEVDNLKTNKPALNKVIGNVEIVQVKSQEFSGEFPCFSILDQKQLGAYWQVCQNNFILSSKESPLQIFRNQLIDKVIQNVEVRNNLKYKVNVQSGGMNTLQDDYDGWSYERQAMWGGMCKDSGTQSPIDIITTEVAATTNQMLIKTNYQGDSETMAIRGPQDHYLVGHFGSALFQNQLDSHQAYYCAWRIEFKFNSEHQIDSTDKDMEVLVYHAESTKKVTLQDNDDTDVECKDLVDEILDNYKKGIESESQERDLMAESTQMVVSFFVSSSATVNAEDVGVFWQGLNEVNFVESGGQSKKYSAVRLDSNNVLQSVGTEPPKTDSTTLGSLEGLVDDGLKKRFQHSFYYYEGSLSQPGCQDNIKRIVMSEGILIDPKSFNNVKEKVLDGFSWKENNRLPVNQGTGTMKNNYVVYRHIDTTTRASCPTREILKKYTDPEYKKKLSQGEYKDYIKLIEQANDMETKYSNAYKNFESAIEAQKAEEKAPKNMGVNFNRKVEMSTNLHHVHKIPRKLVNKIFSSDKPSQMKSVMIGSTNNNLQITYLGKNKQDYTALREDFKNLDDEQKTLKKKANKIIDKHDDDKIEQDKEEQVINQKRLTGRKRY